MYDRIIRGGTVVDGTGSAPRTADVAIQGDRIAEVGRITGGAREEIDADGLVVAPGFVDVHTHYDGQVTWDDLISPSCYHGVTTVVMGNCGVGFAPVAPDRHEWLIGLMEGVEDIPGEVLAEGIQWEWETFPEYLDSIERRPHSIDVGAQLPHAALRTYVMGDRGANHLEVPTPDEIARMGQLAREAMAAGAIGFTTSRSVNHKTKDGEQTPSLSAPREELLGIAREIGRGGKGVFEVISDFDDLEPEFAILREMAAEGGRAMSITVLQSDSTPDKWRRLLGLIQEASDAGVDMMGQVAARPVGLMMTLEGKMNPLVTLPGFAPLADLPLAEKVARLRDPEVRRRLLDEAPDGDVPVLAWGADKVFALGDPPEYEPHPSQSVGARAKQLGVRPIELVYDELLENDGCGVLWVPVMNYAEQNLDVVREMVLHPRTVPGLGDGGAHVTMISDVSFPTYLVSHWGRDRKRGEQIPMERLFKAQCRDTAELVGLRDRGLLAPGMKADVNLIDWNALRIRPPEMAYDLPASGKRLIQKADGYRTTLVAGEVTFQNGEHTGALPGKLVRGAQSPG